jgi:hypothetical protein
MSFHFFLSLLLLPAIQLAESQVPTYEAEQKADGFYREKRWLEARTIYDALEKQSLERAIDCCLQAEDWDGALDRADRFARMKDTELFDRDRWHSWDTRADDAKKALGKTAHLERARELFRHISQEMLERRPLTTWQAQHRAKTACIDLDFKLVDQILGQGFGLTHTWNRDNDWWYAARDPLNEVAANDEERSAHVGVPLNADGQPRFVKTPAKYRADLGPGEKVLFLLKEITDLDEHRPKNRAAQALLKRALIARRLYGPISDPGWDSASFYYYLDQRPSFKSSYRSGPLRLFWELGDDEARTLVDGQLEILKLPPT